MLFSRIIVLACCIIIANAGICQKKDSKFKFGDIKPEDFKPEYYSLDSSADAVWLYHAGSSTYKGDFNGGFSVIFKVYARIRLLHKKSFDDLATVKIPLLKIAGMYQKLDDLHAVTYNVEDGKVTSSAVDKNSFYKDKDGAVEIVKFTFPNLKEGCIIEYSYTVTIPFFAYLPSWGFQGNYPRLWSEYTIEVPKFFDFVVLSQGYLTPAIDTVNASSEFFTVLDPYAYGLNRIGRIESQSIKHTWAYSNVPSIREEKFITNLSNYTQDIEFQLSAVRIPKREPKLLMHSWLETADELMKDENFGLSLNKENGWLKDDIKEVTKGETDRLNKAKKIYEYVRDNYNCIDNSASYLSQPFKKTQQLKKGNVADINMLLIAMLKVAGYNADPVLLSTREHGKIYDMYPILEKFNYVIARLNIDDKSYLLDAANPVLGFGHLKQDCYNGNARVIAAIPDLIDLSADALHNSEIISLFLTNDEGGKMEGTYKYLMGEMQSEDIREKIKKSTIDEYFKDVKKSFSFDINLDNKTIDSLDQREMPVSVQYDISFKPEEDIVYFTPVIADGAYKENPFNAAERYYPVEMPYCMDETYILNMEIPAGYKVDELPKPARVMLNETEGMFEYLIQEGNDYIQLRCRTKLNKATFEPDDYETLRNFFAYIVEKESEQIVFKKK